MNTATCDSVHVSSLQSTHRTQQPHRATFREHRWILRTCSHVLHRSTLYTYTEEPFAPKASWERCSWSTHKHSAQHSDAALHNVNNVCVCVCVCVCAAGHCHVPEDECLDASGETFILFLRRFLADSPQNVELFLSNQNICSVRK